MTVNFFGTVTDYSQIVKIQLLKNVQAVAIDTALAIQKWIV